MTSTDLVNKSIELQKHICLVANAPSGRCACGVDEWAQRDHGRWDSRVGCHQDEHNALSVESLRPAEQIKNAPCKLRSAEQNLRETKLRFKAENEASEESHQPAIEYIEKASCEFTIHWAERTENLKGFNLRFIRIRTPNDVNRPGEQIENT